MHKILFGYMITFHCDKNCSISLIAAESFPGTDQY